MTPRLQGQNCKLFKTPLSRNSQKRLEHKENQTKKRKMTRKPRHRTTWKFNCFFKSVLKYHVFFPASNEANFRVRKWQNKGSFTLNLPREYRTDLNLNTDQEFLADNRVLLSACRTLLSQRLKIHVVHARKCLIISITSFQPQGTFYDKKADYAEKSTMGFDVIPGKREDCELSISSQPHSKRVLSN